MRVNHTENYAPHRVALAALGYAEYDRDPVELAEVQGLQPDGSDWPEALYEASLAFDDGAEDPEHEDDMAYERDLEEREQAHYRMLDGQDRERVERYEDCL